MSVVEYDPASRDLKTISMHAFEDDEMRDGTKCINLSTASTDIIFYSIKFLHVYI